MFEMKRKMLSNRYGRLTGAINERANNEHYWLKNLTGRIRSDHKHDHDLVGKKVRVKMKQTVTMARQNGC